jgi:FixJ family two-component response regulator
MPRKQVIAIVDDDECAREGTIDLVVSMGFIAKAFERAEDFLKSDYLHSSSCLIADVLMPGMTGIELHNRLVEAGNMTPTILITSFPNDGDRARARQAGAICYLAKPFDDEDLLACVRSALEPHEAERTSRRNHD